MLLVAALAFLLGFYIGGGLITAYACKRPEGEAHWSDPLVLAVLWPHVLLTTKDE